MQTFTMIEKENFNSERNGITFPAKNLLGAKIAASKRQAFYGTVIELLDSNNDTVAVKKDGVWVEQHFFNC